MCFCRPYYPYICMDIDLSYTMDTPVRSITFLIGNLSNYGAHLFIQDKVIYQMSAAIILMLLIYVDWQNLATSRPIMQHQLLFSGNDIFLDKSPESIGKSYSVLLAQEVFVQNDPSKNCKNYPTSRFKSYKISPVVVVTFTKLDQLTSSRCLPVANDTIYKVAF